MSMKIIQTARGFFGAVLFNGVVIAMALPVSDRNRAAIRAQQLLRAVTYSDLA